MTKGRWKAGQFLATIGPDTTHEQLIETIRHNAPCVPERHRRALATAWLDLHQELVDNMQEDLDHYEAETRPVNRRKPHRDDSGHVCTQTQTETQTQGETT